MTTAGGDAMRMTSVEFRDYVERIFREQNRLTSALIDAQELVEGERYEVLVAAEGDLLLACTGLNELAIARRDGRTLARRTQARLARSAPECEAATLRVQAVLGT